MNTNRQLALIGAFSAISALSSLYLTYAHIESVVAARRIFMATCTEKLPILGEHGCDRIISASARLP